MRRVISGVAAVLLAGGAAMAVARGVDLSVGPGRLQGPGVTLPAMGRSKMPAYSDLRELGNDVYYDINLGSSSMSALLDWHPFSGGFRTTGGFVINSDQGDDRILPRGRFAVGRSFAVAPGQGINLGQSTPYFGIGWGQSMGKENLLSLSVDVGVMVQPGADARWGVTDVSGSQATVADYLKSGSLSTLIDRLYYSPVVSMGVGFKF